MAARLPLVTTPVGAEGLDATEGKDIIIRNTPEEIAEATLKILNDPKLAERIAASAGELVEKKFGWDKMGEYLESIYDEKAKK